ncbi:MAG: hypothetical protein QGH45_20505 [Myxococcota bacterium]|jgi:hypothetical protein|nr:hypothetical protein [Myxococcota bacterium]
MGFHMNEVMTGQHEFEPGLGPAGKRPMEFRVRWGTDRLAGWANPFGEDFMVNELHGTVTIDGLCAAAPCQGSLALRYLHDQTLRYTFEFEVDGLPYRFVGEKVWLRPWNLPWSHTTCFGRLVRADTGALVSTSVTHFRLRTVPSLLASFRPA